MCGQVGEHCVALVPLIATADELAVSYLVTKTGIRMEEKWDGI